MQIQIGRNRFYHYRSYSSNITVILANPFSFLSFINGSCIDIKARKKDIKTAKAHYYEYEKKIV